VREGRARLPDHTGVTMRTLAEPHACDPGGSPDSILPASRNARVIALLNNRLGHTVALKGDQEDHDRRRHRQRRLRQYEQPRANGSSGQISVVRNEHKRRRDVLKGLAKSGQAADKLLVIRC